MEYSCITDIGLLREKNQDSYVFCRNSYGDALMLVADGIGGSNAGEVASGEAIKYFDFAFKDSGPFDTLEDAGNFLLFHVNSCNKHIRELSKKYDDYRGMGTTLTGLMVTGKGNLVLNCGDSRVYGFKDGQIRHLTMDHTLINQWLREGKITPEEAENHPKKHYLMKAVGIFDECEPDINEVEDMDYYLACSDGLHAYVSDEEIAKIVLDKEKTLDEKTTDLKDLSLLKGGYDNVTVVLMEK